MERRCQRPAWAAREDSVNLIGGTFCEIGSSESCAVVKRWEVRLNRQSAGGRTGWFSRRCQLQVLIHPQNNKNRTCTCLDVVPGPSLGSLKIHWKPSEQVWP